MGPTRVPMVGCTQKARPGVPSPIRARTHCALMGHILPRGQRRAVGIERLVPLAPRTCVRRRARLHPVSLVVQPSLFGSLGKLGVAELGAAVERRPLSDGAWVDMRRGFVTAADELFDALASAVPWHEEQMHIYDKTVRVPRLLAGYPQGGALPHSVIDEARSALNAHYAEELGEQFVSVGLCLYRDGSDSVAWHGDRIARESSRDTMVAIVSLGATRPFGLRPKSGGPGLRFQVGHGDLLVMGGSCQRTWLHGIPKVANCLGARISIQFRPHWGNNLGKPPADGRGG